MLLISGNAMRAHVSETQLSETETLRQLPNMLETDATSEIALDDIDSEYSTKTNEISQIRKPRRRSNSVSTTDLIPGSESLIENILLDFKQASIVHQSTKDLCLSSRLFTLPPAVRVRRFWCIPF